jgi:hypothetical protein
MAMAASYSTSSTTSMDVRSRMAGMKFGPMPWICARGEEEGGAGAVR